MEIDDILKIYGLDSRYMVDVLNTFTTREISEARSISYFKDMTIASRPDRCLSCKTCEIAFAVAKSQSMSLYDAIVRAPGCAAGAYAKSGLLSPDATENGCGEKLKGLLTTLGHTAGLNRPLPPVLGGKTVTKVLTETAKDLLGACFIVETDPQVAYQKIKETITEKRVALGLGI